MFASCPVVFSIRDIKNKFGRNVVVDRPIGIAVAMAVVASRITAILVDAAKIYPIQCYSLTRSVHIASSSVAEPESPRRSLVPDMDAQNP
jgi:hypothetical protein